MKLAIASPILVLALSALPASGVVLLDQPRDTTLGSTGAPNNHEPPSAFPENIVYNVTDVVVGPNDWNVDSITVWAAGVSRGYGSGANVRLYIEEITGTLPTGDPTLSTTLNTTTMSVVGTRFDAATEVTVDVSSLGITLDANTAYWIGVTPNVTPHLAFGGPGNSLMASAGLHGTASAGAIFTGDSTSFSPGQNFQPPTGHAGGWYSMVDGDGSNPSTDLAIRIEGTEVPEPGSLALLGLGGLALLRRRR